MTFEEKMHDLDKVKMHPSDKFKAQILMMTQEFLSGKRDNEPFEQWSYDKILKLSDNHGWL